MPPYMSLVSISSSVFAVSWGLSQWICVQRWPDGFPDFNVGTAASEKGRKAGWACLGWLLVMGRALLLVSRSSGAFVGSTAAVIDSCGQRGSLSDLQCFSVYEKCQPFSWDLQLGPAQLVPEAHSPTSSICGRTWVPRAEVGAASEAEPGGRWWCHVYVEHLDLWEFSSMGTRNLWAFSKVDSAGRASLPSCFLWQSPRPTRVSLIPRHSGACLWDFQDSGWGMTLSIISWKLWGN